MKPHQVRTNEIRKSQRLLLHSIEEMVVQAALEPAPFFRILNRRLRSNPDPQRALNNLHRFLAAGLSSALLRDFVAHPVLLEIAVKLFGQSQYLADILVRHPELFHWLTATPALTSTKDKERLASEAEQALAPLQRMEKQLDALKRFHRRELLRIGTRDILGEANVVTITGELAALADAVVSRVLAIGLAHILGSQKSDIKSSFAVIGLGKLGGDELNFSSDIDLLFVYDRDGELHLPDQRIHSLHEFYTRLSEFIVRRLSEHTDEGHLYRVDLRLRPDGSSGPLAMSRAGYLSYYETRGQLWERQMLTKARVVAGDVEVGERWRQDIEPFVYPRTHMGSPLQEIREIKRRIEVKVEGEENIKLGGGGIRDIEFIVQALQLLNAPADEQLREGNTLRSIDLLARASRISLIEQRHLSEAYAFFRVVEHRLQLMHGLQTHSLPESKEEMRMLAQRLGFRTEASFRARLLTHQRTVRKIFDSVFASPPDDRKAQLQKRKLSLEKMGFLDRQEAGSRLAKLEELLPPLRNSAQQVQFLSALKMHRAPDRGLQNMILLAGSSQIRQTLEHSFQKTKTLDLLTLIASRSSKLSQLLAREPLLFETLIGRPEEVLDKSFAWGFLLESDLTRYREYNEFKIVLRMLLNMDTVEEAACRLTELADLIIKGSLEEIVRDLRSEGIDVVLLALGRLGGGELAIGSDLDLIFVYRGGESVESTTRANAAARKFLESFSGAFKPVYEVDMQIRPEGKSSPLATELGYYREYLKTRASLWERQSLLRFRVIGEAESLRNDVEWGISQTLFGQPLPKNWTTELQQMKRRIERERARSTGRRIDLKISRGGLLDLEFALQAIQMSLGQEESRLRSGSSFEIADRLVESSFLNLSDAKRIRRNLVYLRKLEMFVRINSETSDFVLPDDPTYLQALAAAMGERSGKSLVGKVTKIRSENRQLFKAVLGICRRVG